ncbi:glycoside hydrolase family 32 protein [Microbacterium testaceum]|uniref:Levanase n=1 Tax=Microbacterium testaceum TaxID=2033 RepID=A0A147F6X6_MICTE|nr:glycoside hydrolase family 32 protein [Microbacterium testaceum]KTS11398.1 hypothetical protein RSA3_10445 [Microbacterium testaceum]
MKLRALAAGAATLITAPVLTGIGVTAAHADNPDAEQYRPQYHFSVPDHWKNDPIRPVYLDGEYNYYYLYDVDYNGVSTQTAWRHATTTDQIVYHDEGIAIPEDTTFGSPMAGSIVVDTDNTAGFGAGALVALVSVDEGPTNATDQWVYYSTDGGDTFVPYSTTTPAIANPGPGLHEFRDPKIEWDEANDQWVALVAEPLSGIGFYASSDLKNWTFESFFPAPSGITFTECPDFFQMRADDGTLQWVVGASTGGDMHTFAYWPGEWDGSTFTPDTTVPKWLDYGDDFYAAVTYPDEASADRSTRFLKGWVNYWSHPNTASSWTVDGFTGTDAITRELRLKATGDTYRLVSNPVAALDDYATRTWELGDIAVDGERDLGYHGTSYRLDTTVSWADLDNVAIKLRRSPDGTRDFTVGKFDDFIYVDANDPTMYRESHAPFDPQATTVQLSILVDTTTVEVFVNGGEQALTMKSNLDPTDTGLQLFTQGGAATFGDVTITEFANVNGQAEGGTVFQDFDSGYDGWTTTGSAFGSAPATGTLPAQQPVTGWRGTGLVNSYLGGDASTGTVTSPTFTVSSPYVSFLVGGGDHPTPSEVFADFEGNDWGPGWTATGSFAGRGPTASSLTNQAGAKVADTFVNGGDAATGTITSPEFTITRDYLTFRIAGGDFPWPAVGNASVRLVIDGQVYFSATGDGTPTLRDVAWDVHSLRGKTAHLEIVDESTSTAFGHIMVDQVMWGNTPDAVVGEADTPTAVNLKVGGATVRTVTGTDAERLHWESWDVADFIGQTAQIEVVDQSTAGWGHVNVDEITFSDRPLG